MKLQPMVSKLIMAVVLLVLLLAVWSGLNRMGWSLPPLRHGLVSLHGPLMVSGVLGTLITLERVVALSLPWTYTVPLIGSVGAILLAFNFSSGAYMLCVSSLGLTLLYVPIIRRQIAIFTVTMAIGAISWLIGNVIWVSTDTVSQAVPWWAAFLVLTIAGERLEISRVLRLSQWSRFAFSLALSLIMIGLLVTLASYVVGVRLIGLGFGMLSLWLWKFDVARRTIRNQGQTRFIALNLLVGYTWLMAGGLLAIFNGQMAAGFGYDAWLHAIFLGFVFSMIFAHSLIILPAVTGRSIPFHPVLYAPVLTMQIGLVLRIASDLLLWSLGRRWGGMINGVSLLLFLLTLFTLAIRYRREQKRIKTI